MKINSDLKKYVDMSASLAGISELPKALEDTLEYCMDVACCDSGTLFMASGSQLKYSLMRTRSLSIQRGTGREGPDMPAVELRRDNIVGYCGLYREHIVIDDIYESSDFDFTGPKKFDSITGYRTTSMMVMPLVDHEEELIGVIQLINAQDEAGEVRPFSEDDEYILNALISQASATISTILRERELKDLFHSTISAVTRAIDERTPYFANHTTNVVEYCNGFVDYLNDQHAKGACRYYLDDEARQELLMAARFHDIGKLTVPLEVMNKASRLSPEMLKDVQDRFAYVELLLELACERREITEDDYASQLAGLKYALDVIMEANSVGFLPDKLLERIRRVGSYVYTDHDGTEKTILSPEEVDLLSIRKGTLSGFERKTMESHVGVTSRILDEILFSPKHARIREIAGSHHEFLDGSGYPKGLRGSAIPTEVRILTIADIYDSLRAADRPYRKSMPLQGALGVLREMVDEGKLDKGLVELFCDYADPDRITAEREIREASI